MSSRIVTFTITVTLALSAWAKFYPAAAVGPSGDATGEQTRGQIALAIASADALAATLQSEDPKAWPDGWKALYGTAGAADALLAVIEVRAALVSLRDNWDCLSVETVSLKSGWNSFYVYVDDTAPTASVVNPSGYAGRLCDRVAANFADRSGSGVVDLLAQIRSLAQAFVDVRGRLVKSYASGAAVDWPVKDVYVHTGSSDGDAQFTTDVAAEEKAVNPYLTWSADAPDMVNLPVLPVGRVYTAFSTSTTARTIALLGSSVRAGSMVWHKAGGSDNPAEWNALGIALKSSLAKADGLLQNLDFTCSGLAKVFGSDPEQPSFKVGTSASPLTVADGDVLVANASATSTWYPAPVAQPSSGVVVASGTDVATFVLKNSTTVARKVEGQIFRTGILSMALPGLSGVEVSVNEALGWQPWNFEDAKTNTLFQDELAPGESRHYRVRFDRMKFDLLARAAAYSGDFRRIFSAVMRFRFADSDACTFLSLVGASDNNGVTATWPLGLWGGVLEFDTVSQVKGNQTILHDVPANGRMQVRALVHVDAEGAVRLLHHVLIQTKTTSNAVGDVVEATTLYAGRARPSDASAGSVRRLDSIAMDIDHPVVLGTGTFTNEMAFAWTVAPNGRGNPFYHPYHPEHDGLDGSFKQPAPSGDDMNNYRQGQVKPETWSIEHVVRMSVDPATVSPYAETVTGTCSWELGNVRRKVNGENIRAGGRFALVRMESVGKLTCE